MNEMPFCKRFCSTSKTSLHTTSTVWVGSHTDLNDIVHVWNESVHAHFHQHHQCSAHILANLRVFVTGQVEEVLKKDVQV